MTEETVDFRGACLCGGVVFHGTGARSTASFCHCSQCRKSSGHYWASTRVPLSGITFDSDQSLSWFVSSEVARRGFCNRCGASLFYQPDGADHLGVAMGCLDTPTGITPGKHIFCADAGDYYQIPADAPHHPD